MKNKKMNILLLGSGAREHNFARLLTQSERCEHLFVAPGNAGTATMEKCENIDLKPKDGEHSFIAVKEFIITNHIGLLLIGPEAPLVEGLVDYIMDSGIQDLIVIGPGERGAKLEGSKDFAKNLMNAHGIPTAKSKTFTKLQHDEAMIYLVKEATAPYVLKADGLAAGKGVIITSSLLGAKEELGNMFSGKFGEASKTVVIEEFLKGIELSVITILDGNAYVILPTSKDYKRIGEQDAGKNTGGMGAISPVPFADEAFMQKVEDRIIGPMVQTLQDKNIDYWGFMYFGLMNVEGDPYVIEINCRMGDPEASAILPKIKNDFVDLLEACHLGTLENLQVELDDRPCATVVLVAEGYPDSYEKGKVITGLNKDFGEDVIITHAGTKKIDDKIVTNGGRVIDITCFAETVLQAKEKCLTIAEQIDFEGKYYRHDIGYEFIMLPKKEAV